MKQNKVHSIDLDVSTVCVHTDFLIRIKSKVLGKGLEVPDLSINIRQEDIDAITELIGKDWYTFGKCMKVEESTLDYIKEVGKDKPGRKRKLLEFLISKKVRYEDVVYGLYNSSEERDPSINGILDYLLKTHRQSEGEVVLCTYNNSVMSFNRPKTTSKTK